jgi:hypothetical protein
MAITWRGSTSTPPIMASPDNGEWVFALVNTFRSRRHINIVRFAATGDSIENSTTAGHIMPLLKTWRVPAANVSGGVEILRRPAWDTTIDDPDPAIRLLYAGYGQSEANRITVTGQTGPVWQQFIQRSATAVRQRRSSDNSMLSRVSAVDDFHLYPGEAIAVSWQFGTQPVGGSIFFNIAWEEDETDAGFTLGGTVTLSGSPVSGAKVHILTDSDRDMPDPQIEQVVTDGSGEWSKTLATGVKASVFVQHREGETFYTDEGKPYIEGA